MTKKKLDYEIKCPHCKSKIEAEVTYNQLKGLYNEDEEMALECPDCNYEFDLTKSTFDRIIDDLPEHKKIKIKNYITDGTYSNKLNNKTQNENSIVSFLLNVFYIILIVGFIFVIFLYLPDFLGSDTNSQNNNLNNIIDSEENDSIFEWKNNPYIDDCVKLANEDEIIPVTKYQISTCEIVNGELKVTYTTLG